MINQLTLPFHSCFDATFDNFYGSENQLVLKALRELLRGVGEPFLYLYGSSGCGVSHLLQACCHELSKENIACVHMELLNHQDYSPKILEGLESLALVCIDDIDCIAGNPQWEEALFHLFNRMQLAKKKLLIAAHVPPVNLKIKLADLKSRLASMVVYQVRFLSDEEKLEALQQRAEAQGLELSEEIGIFLLNRCSRNMKDLLELLKKLDEASLEAQRRLTIPFVKKVLNV